ncbi:MAG: hypothetical protein KDI16_11635 [Halioglobus sp.]|nr:hypothetical protein [Halioglobus sp.]
MHAAASRRRHLLFVVGMHRSGTSALCAALQACGASFGDHLLDPMAGVNAEGFWEDAEVVALNQTLLARAGADWYSVGEPQLETDWNTAPFDDLRRAATAIIRRGFGAGRVEAVKDPRLCITLPWWRSLCADLGIESSICVIRRSPAEVARSLQARDGFPVGFGLRLYQIYRRGIAQHVPRDAVCVSYHNLLADPAGVLAELAAALPLEVSAAALASAVRGELRHQVADGNGTPLLQGAAGELDAAELAAEIERVYPAAQTLRDMAACIAARGARLTEVGEAHSEALATLRQRDAELQGLAREHRQALATIAERDTQIASLDTRLAQTGAHLATALATIDERDSQIVEFDRRLADIGAQHSYALQVIDERDAQLQRVFARPGIGWLLRALWRYETR